MAGREEVGIDVTARDMASDELDRVGGHIDNLDGKLNAATGSTGRFGGAFRSMAQGVLMGVGQQAFQMATQAIQGFVGGSIDAASDLAEAQSKVNVVFGESADEIQEWARSADQELGLSEEAALSASGTYMAMFKAMGLGVDDAKELSLATVTLSQDLGSFNNIEPDIMLDKLRAALTGEFEPMKQLGVVLNEATIKTKALEMGVWDGISALTPAVKAQVVYAEVVRQTADAQGDFARTSTGHANQQRINAAEMANASAELGASLLPIASVVMPALTGAFKLLAGGIQLLIANAAPVGAALGAIGIVVGATVVPPFLAWAAATIAATWPLLVLGAAVALFVLAVQSNFLWLGDIVGAVFGVITGIIQGVIGFLLEVASVAVGIAASIPGPWQEGAQAVKDSIDGMKADVASWGKETTDTAGAIPSLVAGTFTEGEPAVRDAAADLIAPLPEEVDAAVDDTVAIASAAPGAIAGELMDTDEIAEAMTNLHDTIVNSVSDAKVRAGLEAALASADIRRGLTSESTQTRLETIQLVDDLVAQYETLAPGALAAGKLINPALVDGIYDNLASVQDAANLVGSQIQMKLEIGASAHVWGENIGIQFADGLHSTAVLVHTRALEIADRAAGPLMGYSPPKIGPLRTIDEGGANVALAWIGHFGAYGAEARRAAEGLATPVADVLGAATPRAGGLAVAAATGAPGLTIINHFGAGSVRSEDDIRDISLSIAERARLSGLTVSQPGAAGGAF